MRTLIADAIVAVAGALVRWVDPTVRELHVVHQRRPFGDGFPLPVLTDPCVPRGKAYITQDVLSRR